MKSSSSIPKVRFSFAVVVFWLLVQSAAPGATFNVTPAVVSNTYVGTISFQVGGLTNGETVMVDNYYDVNRNGVVDGMDMLLQSFRVTDGVWAMIGGVPNINVPGDMTPPDGTISSLVGMVQPQPQLVIGPHLLRLSSPFGNFTPVIQPFTITNWPFPQSISGNVTCDSTNLPYAVVVVLTLGSGAGGGDFVGGTTADALGHYTIKLAPGVYQLMAGRPGYLFNAGAGPIIALQTNANPNVDLTLIPATQALAGRVVDAGNTNRGLPGAFLVLESASGLMAIGGTDANGYFTAGVTPDIWKVGPDSASLAPLGCVEMHSKPLFDSTTGAVSTALIPIPKATAMVYGTIKNETNAPLVGVLFYGDSLTNLYESSGWSAPDGSYCVATLPGLWGIGFDNNAGSLANYVVTSGSNIVFTEGMAVRLDFIAAHATATITGTVRDNSGNPLAGLGVYANTAIDGRGFQSRVQTDTNGNFQLAAFNGTWDVYLSCDTEQGLVAMGYNCTPSQPVSIPPNGPVNFLVYPLGTAQLRSPVRLGAGQFGFQMDAVAGFNYHVQMTTNPAVPGSWTTILTTNLSVNSIFVQDNQATNRQRFYRAIRY